MLFLFPHVVSILPCSWTAAPPVQVLGVLEQERSAERGVKWPRWAVSGCE